MTEVSNNERTRPGISGRRATVAVVGSLLLVLLLSGYGLWMYSRFERAREASVAAWRQVATELAFRYRAAEKLVARGIDSQLIDIALGEKFRLAVDDFSTTTQFETQIASAKVVEQQLVAIRELLHGKPEAAELLGVWEQSLGKQERLSAALENYAETIAKDASLRASLGGKMLLIIVKLRPPSEFRVLAVLPNSRIL